MKKALFFATLVFAASCSGCVDMEFKKSPFEFCSYGFSWYSGDKCPQGVECQQVSDGRLCIQDCPAGSTHVDDYVTCPPGEENVCKKNETGVMCSTSVNVCPPTHTQATLCPDGVKCLTIRNDGGYCVEKCRSGYVRTSNNKCPDGRVEDCTMNNSGVICMKLEGCTGDSCQNAGAYCESGYIVTSESEAKNCIDESTLDEDEIAEFDLEGDNFLCHASTTDIGSSGKRQCRKLIEENSTDSEFPILAEQICTKEQLNPPENALKIHVIDVGNGDAIWIQTPDNHNILVDGGDGGYFTAVNAGPIVNDYLAGHGFRSGSAFDAVFLTHPHSDHFGGFSTIFGTGGYKLKNYIDPMEPNTTELDPEKNKSYFSWVTQVNSLISQSHIYMPASDKFSPGDSLPTDFFGEQVTARYVFSRKKLVGKDENTASIIFRIEFGGRSMIFTGDATSGDEAETIKTDASLVQSNFLKVCHHGSDTASSPAFLKGVFNGIQEADRGAVISSGRREYSGTRTMRPEVVANIRAYVTTARNFLSTNAGDDYKDSDKNAVRDDNILIVIKPGGDYYACYSGVN